MGSIREEFTMYDIRTSDIDAAQIGNINGTNQVASTTKRSARDENMCDRYPLSTHCNVHESDYCQRRPPNVVIFFLNMPQYSPHFNRGKEFVSL